MNTETQSPHPVGSSAWLSVAVGFTKDSMKNKIQHTTKKLAAAKKLTSELRKQLATLTRDASADEARNNLRIAKRKAKFRVGDIIEYTESHHPIVVTEIVAYNGEAYPAYHGYEVANGRLTMNKRGTEGWGTQEESSRIGYSWKKVGHARDLRRATPNAPHERPATRDNQ